MEDWTNALSELGSTAAIIWLLIYIFRVLLPDLVLRVVRELEQQRAEFRAELNRQREALEQLTSAVELLCNQIAHLTQSARKVKDGNR